MLKESKVSNDNMFWLSAWSIAAITTIILVLGTDGCRKRNTDALLKCVESGRHPLECNSMVLGK
jgi:hypothetical protein